VNLSYNYQFYNQFTNWHIIDDLQSKPQKTTDKQKLQHATIQPKTSPAESYYQSCLRLKC